MVKPSQDAIGWRIAVEPFLMASAEMHSPMITATQYGISHAWRTTQQGFLVLWENFTFKYGSQSVCEILENTILAILC